MTESDYSLMKTPQKPLISVSKRGQYAIKCTDWSEWAYLLQSMHRGLIKSAMLPPTPPISPPEQTARQGTDCPHCSHICIYIQGFYTKENSSI